MYHGWLGCRVIEVGVQDLSWEEDTCKQQFEVGVGAWPVLLHMLAVLGTCLVHAEDYNPHTHTHDAC